MDYECKILSSLSSFAFHPVVCEDLILRVDEDPPTTESQLAASGVPTSATV